MITFSNLVCSSMVAPTCALVNRGVPMAVYSLEPTISTLSRKMSSPTSTGNVSVVIRSPFVTLYCFPPTITTIENVLLIISYCLCDEKKESGTCKRVWYWWTIIGRYNWCVLCINISN